MEGPFFEYFQKKSKKFQNSNQKRTKSLPKTSISVLNMFWGTFFAKFLTSFPWKDESSRIFEKNQKFSKFQKAENRYQKYPNVFWTCFGANFSNKKIFAQCSMEGRVF